MTDVVLVVSTKSENSILQFMSKWDSINLFDYVNLIVVEDNPQKTFHTEAVIRVLPNKTTRKSIQHYSWQEIEENLKDNAWIISRNSDSIRSFGYLMAYKQGCDFILNLADTCYPPNKDEDSIEYADATSFLNEHIKALTTRSQWQSTITGVRARGLPYYNVGINNNVLINYGLCTGNQDIDGARYLMSQVSVAPQQTNDIIPANVYAPLCGLNWMAKSEAAVLLYQPPMNSVAHGNSIDKLDFDGFGDIWSGIFAKKVCDCKGKNISVGIPFVKNSVSINPFLSLKKQVNCLEINEVLWKLIDNLVIDGLLLTDYYVSLARSIKQFSEIEQLKHYENYFNLLSEAMQVWAKLFVNTKE